MRVRTHGQQATYVDECRDYIRYGRGCFEGINPTVLWGLYRVTGLIKQLVEEQFDAIHQAGKEACFGNRLCRYQRLIYQGFTIQGNGKIAQFGSRLVEDVSNQLFKQFVANFTKKLEGVEISEADQNVDAGGMIKSVVKGLFSSKKS